MEENRRNFLISTPILFATGFVTLLFNPNEVLAKMEKEKKEKKENSEEEIGAIEDLMREHGVLNRLLLIYEESIKRIHLKKEINPEIFVQTANLIQKFVEDYHEKLEEKFIFPEFKKHKKLEDLVHLLEEQHQVGRKITNSILQFAKNFETKQQEIVTAAESFIRMYRPHEAREDTVLFPSLHTILSSHQLKELGEKFEEEEDRLFGENGFKKIIEEVESIEKKLDIYDLKQFTPNSA